MGWNALFQWGMPSIRVRSFKLDPSLSSVYKFHPARSTSVTWQTKHTKIMTRKIQSLGIALLAVLTIPSCASTGKGKAEAKEAGTRLPIKSVQHGEASWYSIKTNGGTHTASGRRLCNQAPTAAHKTLPMGTKVRVINQINGKSEIVTITDRGPYTRGRIIDLTIGSAERLGFAKRGIAPVKVEVLGHIKAEG
jgi:rare lipoprotein A